MQAQLQYVRVSHLHIVVQLAQGCTPEQRALSTLCIRHWRTCVPSRPSTFTLYTDILTQHEAAVFASALVQLAHSLQV